MSIESRSQQYGSIFGDWHIGRKLGSGTNGQSAVFELYRDHEGWREYSALKVISLIEERGRQETMPLFQRNDYSTASRERRSQAEQEVRLMDQVRGKTNIVDYLDHKFFDWSDESGFGTDLLIRMELLSDLRSLIKDRIKEDKCFTEREIIKIGRDLCQALVICHGKKILHRDIKPENVFINNDGDYKLGDFGVSRILNNTSAALASTGIGTPAYSAPEQFAGRYDHRVDIYSLGLVLYELSNRNRLPFAASSYARQEDIQKRQLGTPLPKPEGISEGFWRVLQKACAYRAADRYGTAQEFLEALCNLNGGQFFENAKPNWHLNQTVKATGTDAQYTTAKADAVADWNETQYAGAGTEVQSASRETVFAKHEENRTPPPVTKENRKKGIFLGVLCGIAAVCAGAFLFWPGDRHEHTWVDATCTAPRTCEECGETEGNALEHRWLDATCEKARSCSRCGITEGTALGHQWLDATCTSPMICAVCNQVQGNAASHQWIDADSLSPKTCLACGATEGRSIGYSLSHCIVTANSNETGSNSDVALGTWNDEFGQSYASALRFWVADFGTWSDTEWIEYDINSQFRQLDLAIAAETGNTSGAYFQVMVYADGELVYTSQWIGSDTYPIQETVNIENCSRLRIVCTTDAPAYCYGIVQGTLFN